MAPSTIVEAFSGAGSSAAGGGGGSPSAYPQGWKVV